MKTKIIKLSVSLFLLFIIGCTGGNPKIETVSSQDTSKISTKPQMDTVFSYHVADATIKCCNSNFFIRYESMMGLCSDCFQYNDTSVSIFRQKYKSYDMVNYVVEINEYNIAVKINLVPRAYSLDGPFENPKNVPYYINRGAIIANRARFLAKLKKTNIFDIKPLSNNCMGTSCVRVHIKKDKNILCFDYISPQDTAYQQAVKKVEMLIEKELAEAGITF